VEVYGLALDSLLAILKKHGKPNLVGKAFGVITMTRDGAVYDFAFPRTERKTGEGHRGFDVTVCRTSRLRDAPFGHCTLPNTPP
jgi:tRNA nucleotidyltransferase (CCA-adding enzyme)